jgi:hypothetical protein
LMVRLKTLGGSIDPIGFIHPPADLVHQELAIGTVHHEVQRGTNLERRLSRACPQRHSVHNPNDC